MAVVYDIQADIVDIRFDKPKHQDTFLVDTNVWYWLTYSQASVTAKSSQVRDYPNYFKKLRSVSSTLHCCTISLAELAHIIENSEYEIFCDAHKKNPKTYPKKEFRHSSAVCRHDVTQEIESAWMQVQQFSACLPLTIDEAAVSTFLVDLKSHKLDGYDLFYLDVIRKNDLQILTDDGDFATVPGITVFTANLAVIDAARVCGKLRMR